jgi:hypothetical protein
MSTAAYVEIEWIGITPNDTTMARASECLQERDYEAPALTEDGLRGHWRSPMTDFCEAQGIADFLGLWHPVRVRMAWGWDAGPRHVEHVPWVESCDPPAWACKAVAEGWEPPHDWMPGKAQ